MTLHGSRSKQQINLIIIIPEPPQILNNPQTSLAIRDGSIEEILLPGMIDRKALESEIPRRAERRLDGPGQEHGRFETKVGHGGVAVIAVAAGGGVGVTGSRAGVGLLQHGEAEGDLAGHFDGAAEGDLAVALGEVEVADGELGAGDVDGEVDFAAAGEVFDVAVSAVFGAALLMKLVIGLIVNLVKRRRIDVMDTYRNSPSALPHDILPNALRSESGVGILRLRQLGHVAIQRCMSLDQLGFAPIPFRQDLGRRRHA